MKEGYFSCENYQGISLVSIASQLFVWIIPRRLSFTRGRCLRENQACFPPGWECICQNIHSMANDRTWIHYVCGLMISVSWAESGIWPSQPYNSVTLPFIDRIAKEIHLTFWISLFQQTKRELFVLTAMHHRRSSREVVFVRAIQFKLFTEIVIKIALFSYECCGTSI